MRQRDRSTAPVVQFSSSSVSKARSLLDEQNMQRCEVVTFRGYSDTLEKANNFGRVDRGS